ncbi:DUF488 domain-containing protein [Fluoribacter dumoffii]|uniref:Uncharacterized conserved protein n=1 Tax=Fluoribacter dumoffii TaxID=463 RepID=A0A377GD25_9GAMM|nr:DUF488 domain-containing protein [Fluoribacter dumoffii]KTC90728.1 uroporphyrin-III C- methyltransferase [Fluoribacter dumoffii NY 23]MCW8386408.1 DUF488 domain-containing protein [Fluoribacter dumoffii]MCW8419461.1 DUF488 domain-containing protein [Fluoribacter dumoffii]MCW8452664.1 DUF488 domain-containing protein [Fluoribacter dumoffii]MCW8460086.1 DUF488 domain-containing protein [Fluoribacter dumoffii]
MHEIKLKRIYEHPESSDGFRILVDKLWPRGMKKEAAAVDLWLKDIAPSNELRSWFNHESAKWEEFEKRYRKELGDKEEPLHAIITKAQHHTVTLLYSARDEQHNNAVALLNFIKERKK